MLRELLGVEHAEGLDIPEAVQRVDSTFQRAKLRGDSSRAVSRAGSTCSGCSSAPLATSPAISPTMSKADSRGSEPAKQQRTRFVGDELYDA